MKKIMDTLATVKNVKDNVILNLPSKNDNKLISRPEVIGTISDIFSKDVSVVFIEGNQGCGATTALKQFEESGSYACFSVFLNPASKLSYSADYVRVILTEKLKDYMDDLTPDGGVIEKGEFNTILMKFRSRLRGDYAYFLIDGLAHIPAEDEAEIRQLFSEVLPIGVDYFRFIISGSQSKFSKYLNGTSSKHFQLPRFSFAEISQLFSDFNLTEGQLTEIQHACRGNAYPLTYREAMDILSLLELLTCDWMIYDVVENLCDAIKEKKNKGKFTAQQRKDIGERIIQISEISLPDKNNIRHEGYKLIANAKAYSILEKNIADWIDLIQRADKIINTSDRAFVYIILAHEIPAAEKYRSEKEKLFNKAQLCYQNIPSLIDKLGRMQLFSRSINETNSASAKSVIRNAFLLAQQLEDVDDTVKHQKAILNAADQIDPDFADDLLDMLDNDPARAEAKEQVVQEMKTMKAKKDMADLRDRKSISNVDLDLFPDASWRNLKAILAGRIETKPLDIMASYVSGAAEVGLDGLYPALCWYIENSARKYISPNDARSNLLPLCEVLLMSTELAFAVVGLHKGERAGSTITRADETSLFVRHDMRDAAVGYLDKWISENCNHYIKICDPYFSSDDLYILKIILSKKPECEVQILTGSREGISLENFEMAWRRISDQSPPETTIFSVSDINGKSPIHDRWIITEKSGLRVGTSLNSLGKKLSEISVMREPERVNCENEIDRFYERRAVVSGARVRGVKFNL